MRAAAKLGLLENGDALSEIGGLGAPAGLAVVAGIEALAALEALAVLRAARGGAPVGVGLRRISVNIVKEGGELSFGSAALEAGAVLLSLVGGGGGRSLVVLPLENRLGDSGEDAGETGFLNVETPKGARGSPFWYSGVGGRLTAGRPVVGWDLKGVIDLSLSMGLAVGLAAPLEDLEASFVWPGRTLRPGRPPAGGSFRGMG